MCEENIQKICKKINDYVFSEQAQRVNNDVRQMIQKFQEKADNSKTLVEFEAFLLDCQNNQKKAITDQYTDLIKWMEMLYEYYQFQVIDDSTKSVEGAYKQTNKIATSIENQSEQLDKQRRDIETKLLTDIKTFKEELNEVKIEVEKLKDKNTKRTESYNEDIAIIQQRLANLTTRLAKINDQEVDLEWTPSEEPLIPSLKKQIKPYEDLGFLTRDFNATIRKSWKDDPIKSLNPEEVDKEHKRMFSLAQRLENIFN